jgi:hypothetical protein
VLDKNRPVHLKVDRLFFMVIFGNIWLIVQKDSKIVQNYYKKVHNTMKIVQNPTKIVQNLMVQLLTNKRKGIFIEI